MGDYTDRNPSLFNHRESADLTLVCVCQEFKIHSVLLCPRLTFFQAAFEGGFKVNIIPL